MSAINRLAGDLVLRCFEALEARSRRSTRIYIVTLGVITTTAMWSVHLKYPFLIHSIFGGHGPLHELTFALGMLVVLMPPFFAFVSLGYLLFPQTEQPIATRSGPMAGYMESQRTEKRWKIIVTAGVLAAADLFLMIFTGSSF